MKTYLDAHGQEETILIKGSEHSCCRSCAATRGPTRGAMPRVGTFGEKKK